MNLGIHQSGKFVLVFYFRIVLKKAGTSGLFTNTVLFRNPVHAAFPSEGQKYPFRSDKYRLEYFCFERVACISTLDRKFDL